ncbi:Helix-loop-helix protein delilah [Armadillidium nasatum]|uniref:Helix-loop-helix protein delilah n=1 Tax=Armadillidium nasatum TaxID=96803 RepID=A0A5N5TGJ2_9CRUS|nr:Helix-loop-helix protein delilah [Armadillidium nasatum]
MESDSINSVKYTLRTKSLMKRIESERSRQGGKKKEPKEKQKPPPLSKYRRKTANARERNRMKEINEAFETLQKTLPDLPGVDAEKLTKITVLRLAVNYIKILSCVKDGDFIGTKDIDELRKLWCLNNAHMARPEHCVRPIFKTSKISNTQNKSIKVLNQKQKPIKIKQMNPNKTCDASKEKQPPVKKKPSKSRTRGKVCKTASVATSNGAYITLKNVAFQCTPNRKGHIDNKPLMMSMTVKRPRLEHVSFKKPPKIARYDPPVVKPKIEKEIIPCKNIINYNTFSVPYNENLSPLLGNIPFEFVSPESTSPNEDKFLTNFTFYDLETPVIKNDVILEFPKNNLFTSPNIKDTTLRGEENSVPISPKSPFTFLSNDELSPNNNRYSNLVSPCHSSDSDSILTPSIEFDSILGTEPFEEELDHLASSLVETDDALNLFLDHHSSNFIC